MAPALAPGVAVSCPPEGGGADAHHQNGRSVWEL